MLDVLPRQQLLSQLRECVAIAKDIYEKGTTNHILINPIMDYDLNHFRLYCAKLIDEMENRGYNISSTTKDKLHTYIGYNNTLEYCLTYEPLFEDWHDTRYLVICIYNLYEKYLRGGILQEEWDEIYYKYHMYIDF